MPRTTTRAVDPSLSSTLEPLEAVFTDLRVLLEARRAEYVAAADRITDILTSMQPKPRIGRPPAKR